MAWIPIVEDEAVGDRVFLIPPIGPVTIYVPPEGYTPEQMTAAIKTATLEAIAKAAREKRIGVITNIGQE